MKLDVSVYRSYDTKTTNNIAVVFGEMLANIDWKRTDHDDNRLMCNYHVSDAFIFYARQNQKTIKQPSLVYIENQSDVIKYQIPSKVLTKTTVPAIVLAYKFGGCLKKTYITFTLPE